MKKSDIIIIGSGPGGYNTAVYAAKSGLSATIIEAHEAGGTCLNCGCIPTKSLCKNAEIIENIKNADTFGLQVQHYDIDFAKIMKRKDDVVQQLRNGVETLMQSPGITFVHGLAKFKDAQTVVVDEEEYTADNIIIATGSSSKIPPIEGTSLPGVVDSTELLNITSIPARLCIIGAGVIGMEFASIFNSFGSKVTVIEFMKECLPMLDGDIAKRLRQTLNKRGIDFIMQSAVKNIQQSKGENGNPQLAVNYEKKGAMMQTDADVVLIATGRKPNIAELQLDKAGIAYSAKGISVDGNYKTNVSNIYAIGDVNGLCMLAHAATFQGVHAINHITGKTDSIQFDTMPAAIFTNPEAACVGKSEEQLKAAGVQYECRKGFYRSNGKALAMHETDGLVKLFIDKADNKIIGCHAFGAHSSDMVQEVAALMHTEATATTLADIIHIHPTLAEILHGTVGI